MSELLKQVRVIDPVAQSDRIQDIWLENSEIKAISDCISDYPAATQVQDCQGLILGPGLIDLYSHSGEPGFEERETLESFLQAARAGGFTRATLLPTTDPPVDHPGILSLLMAKTDPLPGIAVSFWGAMTQGVKGEQMSELGELATANVVGFADGRPLTNLLLLRRLLEYGQPLGKPMAFWPVAVDLAANGVMREGRVATRLGLPGIPVAAETAALAALLEVVAQTGTPVHVMRVSTARSVELIQAAKEGGLPVTASVSWMHLLLDTEVFGEGNRFDFMPYDPNLRLASPLGNGEDRMALIWGVHQGVIDAIAIDHTPYTYEEKTVGFESAPPGAIGLELALPLLWHGLVETEQLSAVQLWRSLSTYPALCLNQTPPSLALGQPLELILFDPQTLWKVNSTTLKSRSLNTPWFEQELRGKVIRRFDQALY